MIDIKAIKAAAKEDQKRDNTILLRPSTVIAMCDEIERLTACLKKANDQAEHFEREWYLRGDEIEKLRKDAARYQWLRNKGDGWYVGTEYATYNDKVVDGEFANYSGMQMELDAAIDAAIGSKT